VSDTRRLARSLQMLLDPRTALGVELWDGTRQGSAVPKLLIAVRDPIALRHLIWGPGELGFGRAYVSGLLDLEGDLELLAKEREELAARLRRGERSAVLGLAGVLWWAARTAGVWPPPKRPPEEVKLRGRRHSKRRDAKAISHHYDAPEDFYRLFLGATMTYSCAYFARSDFDLDRAQEAKMDLVCCKLGLKPGMRFLDIGCGWGSLVLHAAKHYGVQATGVTLSEVQAKSARRLIKEEGLETKVEIRHCDYRDVSDGPYDAIASVGMFEHVGAAKLATYFSKVASLLATGGRFLNHAISRPAGIPPSLPSRSFVNRYVFPDGELHEVGAVVSAIQAVGLEVRDVESLREHYVETLNAWRRNLEQHWDRAVALVGEARARIWRLYMAGAAERFRRYAISVHQTLAVKTSSEGVSGMERSRLEVVAALQERLSAAWTR
jgi:cyclopropane-fatty-acyl-phospholipid synthase